MQVRILCATALGNHVALPPRYYSNKSQFMIMTQEESLTPMHPEHGVQRSCIFSMVTAVCSRLCSSQNSTVTYVIM